MAAARVASLQALLQRKGQLTANVSTNQSYLSATDTAMSQISGMMAEVRGAALERCGDVNRATMAVEPTKMGRAIGKEHFIYARIVHARHRAETLLAPAGIHLDCLRAGNKSADTEAAAFLVHAEDSERIAQTVVQDILDIFLC